MRIWRNNRRELESVFSAASQFDQEITRYLNGVEVVEGICIGCHKTVEFSVAPGAAGDGWKNLNEGMVCPVCNTNGRLRNIIDIWRELRRHSQPAQSLIMERVTPLYSMMKAEDPDLIGCEYLGREYMPGSKHEVGSLLIQHEDFGALSMPDDSLDLLMHFDVLEHVPNLITALDESYRILRPGGSMLFTLPFYHDLDDNIVCATIDAVGNITHHRPPSFHGNPLSEKGALVFTIPGWEVLKLLTVCGFSFRVSFTLDPVAGIVSNGCPFPDGHVWPLVFHATKPVQTQ